MSLSNLLMRLATRWPPAKHADWARAMQAEYDVLERGKLVWALGCLATATGWWLKTSEAVYLTVVPVSVFVLPVLIEPLLFAGFWPRCGVQCLGAAGAYVFFSLSRIGVCIALGAWRPDRIVTTGVLAAGTFVLQGYVIFATIRPTPSTYIHFFDLPPVAGELILLTGCLLSATLGGALRSAMGLARRA